jgi:hypothetical protein
MRFPEIREYDRPRYAYSRFLWPRINRRQGKKLEVVALVEPRTFEGFVGEADAPGQLHHGILLFSRLWFVIQDREEAGAELQEVDVAGDGVVPEGAGELILMSEPQNVFLDNDVY